MLFLSNINTFLCRIEEDLNEAFIDMDISGEDVLLIVIFLALLFPSIKVNKRWVNKYKNIPDSKTVAKLIKTKRDTEQYADGKGEYEWVRTHKTVGIYEYYINGKRHKIGWAFRGTPPETRNICFKKYSLDARYEEAPFLIPSLFKVLWGMWYFICLPVLSQGIFWLLTGHFFYKA